MWREIIKRYEGMLVTEAIEAAIRDGVGHLAGRLQVGQKLYGLAGTNYLHFGGISKTDYETRRPAVVFHKHFTVYWTDVVVDESGKLVKVSSVDPSKLKGFYEWRDSLAEYKDQVICHDLVTGLSPSQLPPKKLPLE